MEMNCHALRDRPNGLVDEPTLIGRGFHKDPWCALQVRFQPSRPPPRSWSGRSGYPQIIGRRRRDRLQHRRLRQVASRQRAGSPAKRPRPCSSIPFAAVSVVTTLNSPLIASCSSSDWRRSSSSSMTRIVRSLIMAFLPTHGRLLSDL
jgi:hypothetical protein